MFYLFIGLGRKIDNHGGIIMKIIKTVIATIFLSALVLGNIYAEEEPRNDYKNITKCLFNKDLKELDIFDPFTDNKENDYSGDDNTRLYEIHTAFDDTLIILARKALFSLEANFLDESEKDVIVTLDETNSQILLSLVYNKDLQKFNISVTTFFLNEPPPSSPAYQHLGDEFSELLLRTAKITPWTKTLEDSIMNEIFIKLRESINGLKDKIIHSVKSSRHAVFEIERAILNTSNESKVKDIQLKIKHIEEAPLTEEERKKELPKEIASWVKYSGELKSINKALKACLPIVTKDQATTLQSLITW